MKNKTYFLPMLVSMLIMCSCSNNIKFSGSNDNFNNELNAGRTEHQQESTQKDGDNLFVFRQNNKYGYMDVEGNITIEAQFDGAYDFVDNRARVFRYIDGWGQMSSITYPYRWGLVDTHGKLIVPIEYAMVSDYHDGLASVSEVAGHTTIDAFGETFYVDCDGNRSSQKYLGRQYFKQGFMPTILRGGGPPGPPIPNPPPRVWSYIDSYGERATEKEFEEAGEFNDGYAVVKSEGKYGLIDISFNNIIDFQYDGLSKVGVNSFAAQKDEKWGLIDCSNNVIVDFRFYGIEPFSEGLAAVSLDRTVAGPTSYSYISINGEIQFDSRYLVAYPFIDGFACVVDKVSQKYGVINQSGEYAIEPLYDYLASSKKRLFKVEDYKTNEIHYINVEGIRVGPK